MNPHIPEWKNIRKWYEEMEQTPQIQFRIERISALIREEEKKEKELNHFK